jgi:hypothetical protein
VPHRDMLDIFGFGVMPSQVPAEPDLATLEAAIGHLLAGTGSLESVARRHGLDAGMLGEQLARYRRGGRGAIGRG